MKRLSFIMTLFVMSLVIVSCGQAGGNQVKEETGEGAVQVMYFHGKQRCATCQAMEEQTKVLLDSEYQAELQEGKLKFRVVDFSEPEGEAVADRYEVAFSSLLLDKDGQIDDLTDMGFRYARTEPETFKANLKTEIDQLLK